MFGKRDLLKAGAQTEGVILERQSTLQRTQSRVVIAVKFEDGETTQFDEVMTNYCEPEAHGLKGLLGNLTGDTVVPMSFIPGDRIPVRYDPSNRHRLAVDVPEFQARTMQAWAAKQDAARDRALASLDSPAPQGGTPLDPELQALMDADEAERNRG